MLRTKSKEYQQGWLDAHDDVADRLRRRASDWHGMDNCARVGEPD